MTIFHVLKYGHRIVDFSLPSLNEGIPQSIIQALEHWHEEDGFWLYGSAGPRYSDAKKKKFHELLLMYENPL